MRDDFPKDFVFGSGTSAYQVEGAAAGDGRLPSIWDTFAHNGRVPGASNVYMASDEYHKYKEVAKLMEETGFEGYRFSISWSRLIPNGRGEINPKGLEHYNNLSGIQPHVTLFHFDLPQILEDEYQGWLSPRIVDDFTAYADVCFREFGDRVSYWTTLNEPNVDRVSYWTTLNEPNVVAVAGYDSGTFPCGRCSYPFGHYCSCGNSVFEPCIAAHNFLLGHSSAYALYKRKYRAKQQGSVGINIFTYHFMPKTDAMEDVLAAKRSQEFYAGWFMRPLVNGDYPDIKLPKFSRNQSRELVGAFDFIGVNYYSTLAAKDNPSHVPQDQRDFLNDSFAKLSVVDRDESALRNGSITLGYFTWSFLDVFELMDGYKSSYDMKYVDFGDKELKRYPKLSRLTGTPISSKGTECCSRKQFFGFIYSIVSVM